VRIHSAIRLVGFSLQLFAIGCTVRDEDWRSRLSDVDPNVRRAAVREIGDSPDSSAALTVLVPVLKDSDATVRLAAALAILRFDPQNEACRPVIEQALREGQGPTFIAVGACGAKAAWAVPILVSLMKDGRAAVRALAAKTLGEVGVTNETVESLLRRGLRDASPTVRGASQRALDRLHSAADASPPAE
jgi:HEAT repeat protein